MGAATESNVIVGDLVTQLSELMNDLALLIAKFSVQQYRTPQAPLPSSIGAHVRHILECHQQFVIGRPQGLLNYDDRARCAMLEESPIEALTVIKTIRQDLAGIDRDGSLSLEQGDGCRMATSVARELRHLVDHATHHLATIAIAGHLAQIALPDDLGLAITTRNNQKTDTLGSKDAKN